VLAEWETITVYVLHVGSGAPTFAHFAETPVVGIYIDKRDARADAMELLATHDDYEWYVVMAAPVRRYVKRAVVESVG
jgi:hypothetical protein